MSADPRLVTNTETWAQWESQVVNGVFPLRRFLAGSGHSAVFLTEYKAENIANAAIKFVPADGPQAETLLAQWRTAAALSHPHLVRLFDVGRYQCGGKEFLFVVMEYAEQTLAQILQHRALDADEAKELLIPTLNALVFLHLNHLVQGQLKPSNFLAVGDTLKLASESVSPDGDSASDIRRLGMTLVEALTRSSVSFDEQSAIAALPANVPVEFADTLRRCLSPVPADRPTAIELEARYKPVPQTQSIVEPAPSALEAPREATAPRVSPKLHPLPLTIAAALLLSLLVWAGMRVADTPPTNLQQLAAPAPVTPSAAEQPASQPAVEAPQPAPIAASPSVLREVSPDVPRATLDKIQGRVFVTVRVLVDPSGNVIGALLEDPGSSKYFARVAGEAAREWKFTPTEGRGARVWLLRFKFTREGVTTRVIPV